MPSFPTNDSNGAILGKVGEWLRATFALQESAPTGGPVITSPNGTRYRLGVADDGSLTTTSL